MVDRRHPISAETVVEEVRRLVADLTISTTRSWVRTGELCAVRVTPWPAGPTTVTVHVTLEPLGSPLPMSEVEIGLVAVAGTTAAGTATRQFDREGRCVFEDVPAGDYRLTVVTATASVTLADDEPDRITIPRSLAADTDVATRRAAVAALAQVDDPRALQPLLDRLGDEDDHVRLMAATAIRDLAEAGVLDDDDDSLEVVTAAATPAAAPLWAIVRGVALGVIRQVHAVEEELFDDVSAVFRQMVGQGDTTRLGQGAALAFGERGRPTSLTPLVLTIAYEALVDMAGLTAAGAGGRAADLERPLALPALTPARAKRLQSRAIERLTSFGLAPDVVAAVATAVVAQLEEASHDEPAGA